MERITACVVAGMKPTLTNAGLPGGSLQHPATRRAALELLTFAAHVLDARFALLHLDDGSSLANDDGAPLALAPELAEWAAAQQHVLMVPERERQRLAGGAQFCAAVALRDDTGTYRGTLAVLDAGYRPAYWSDRQHLVELGAQFVRLLDTDRVLAESEARARCLATLIDALPVPAYIIENGRFAGVNARFAQTLGYTKEEMLALDSAADLVVAEEKDFVAEMLRRRESGEQHEARYMTRVRCRDGRTLDIEIHSTLTDVEGRRAVVGVAVDVSAHSTERRRVHEREEYFRALTENVSDMIVILDRAGVITYASPSVTRALGYTADDLAGTDYCHWIHAEDRERVNESFALLLRGGNPLPTAYRVAAKDGAWRVFESVATNLLRHSQVRGVVINTRDITDRKLFEDEAEKLHRLTSLGHLAAQVAHEFNNVLMGIQPLAEIVRRRGGDAQLLRAAESILAAVTRGKRITTDILRFGRPAGLTLRSVEVHKLLGQLGEELRTLVGESIELEVRTDERPMHVYADPSQLSQVLVNVALNARDAMAAHGGRLTITAGPGDAATFPNGGEYVHFTIADTGEGIGEADLPYIFEPLFTTKKTGTGLGLSVVWQIVAAHRGHISVESEKGIGTSFHIYVPALDIAVEPQAAEQEPEQPRTTALHVLLVEDDDRVANGLRLALEASGLGVTVARSGGEVAPRMAEQRPDVVVLDLSLPDEDGRSVYERDVAPANVPVIFSSGHSVERDVETLLHHRGTAFLMKPYSVDDLLATIRQVADETPR